MLAAQLKLKRVVVEAVAQLAAPQASQLKVQLALSHARYADSNVREHT